MISNDPKILEEGSSVRARQVEYAKNWKEVHIIVYSKKQIENSKNRAQVAQRAEQVIAPNCWAYSTMSSSKLFAPWSAMRLGRFIIEKRGVTDVTCQDPFLTAMAGVGLKKQFPQVQLEIQVHTDIGSPHFTYSFGNKVRKFLALNYLPKADKIRVVSERIKRWVQDAKLTATGAEIEVRPISVDTDRIRLAPIISVADLHERYPQFKKIVLMASRLEPEKNIGYALDIWKKVANKNTGLGLMIVGSGSEKSKLQALCSRFALSDSVVFEDWVDQPTLYSYYKTADLFLNTSLFEGYGMTLVEARAAGCKVVSTDVGVAQEIGATIIPFDDAAKASDIICQELSHTKKTS